MVFFAFLPIRYLVHDRPGHKEVSRRNEKCVLLNKQFFGWLDLFVIVLGENFSFYWRHFSITKYVTPLFSCQVSHDLAMAVPEADAGGDAGSVADDVSLSKASFLCVRHTTADDLNDVQQLKLALQHAGQWEHARYEVASFWELFLPYRLQSHVWIVATLLDVNDHSHLLRGIW